MDKRAYDGEIKLKRGIKRIKINDNGDYLELQINDFTFPTRYMKFLNEIQEMINLKIDDDEKLDILEKLKVIEEKQVKIVKKINSFFNDEVCQKVFGTNYPYIDDITEFLIEISRLIEKFTGEKVNNFKKIEDRYLSKQKSRQRA